MKKQYVSIIFTSLAMALLIISRVIREAPMDWLGYAAIVVLVTSLVSLVIMHKNSKEE